MAYSLTLTAALSRARWKVKIRDKETCEPPHVTILRGVRAWRVNLRTGAFMDSDPNPAEVPAALLAIIHDSENWRRLQNEWDRLYPNNPISSED